MYVRKSFITLGTDKWPNSHFYPFELGHHHSF